MRIRFCSFQRRVCNYARFFYDWKPSYKLIIYLLFVDRYCCYSRSLSQRRICSQRIHNSINENSTRVFKHRSMFTAVGVLSRTMSAYHQTAVIGSIELSNTWNVIINDNVHIIELALLALLFWVSEVSLVLDQKLFLLIFDRKLSKTRKLRWGVLPSTIS